MADILHQITIEATPSDIYAALTTINGIKNWWTDACELASQEGGQCKFWFDQKSTVLTMRAQRLLPDQRVFWRCIGGPKEWVNTELWWEITQTSPQQCRVDFKHMNWANDEGSFALCNSTWGGLMHRLKQSCESQVREPLFMNQL